MTDNMDAGDAWRMPAEWEPHERCLMAWPTRVDLWGSYFELAEAEFAATADAISAFEPVTMVAAPGRGRAVTAACPASVEVIELPIDDSWLRDSGPIIVANATGDRRGIDFRFNSWGERFSPWNNDAAMAAELLNALGVPRHASSMVLEGGSITVDGEGTLITTEQCLLNPNRNPTMTRDDIEHELKRTLGIRQIIWLKHGHFEDAHTDGHVDGVCTYVRSGVVIAQTCDDPTNPNFALMAENMDILRTARDANGRALQIIELPHFPYYQLDGLHQMTSYPNFYIANDGVIVPVAGHPLDHAALAVVGSAFPDREVIGVPSRIIAYGGGGTHCITQQVPARS